MYSIDNKKNGTLLADTATLRIEFADSNAKRIMALSDDELKNQYILSLDISLSEEEIRNDIIGQLKSNTEKALTKTATIDTENTNKELVFNCTLLTNTSKEFLMIEVYDKKEVDKAKEQENEQQLNNERLESLFRINQHQSGSLQGLLDFALAEAIKLTQSKLGYIYFYDEKKKEFTLNTWSKEAMRQCEVMNPETKYMLENTGCWGEAVRKGKPFLLNNYSLDNKYTKGTPDGHVKLKRFLTIPVFSDMKIAAVVGVANKTEPYNSYDIRQLNLLMDSVWKNVERQRFQDELMEAKTKAEESHKLKTAFLANMSHEIRTPMNVITGFAELLCKPNISDERKKYYTKTITENSNQLLRIVNDIVDLSKIETKQVEVVKTNVSVNDLLFELFMMFKPKAADKNIKLQMQKSLPDHLAIIETDAHKLQQIVDNLLGNALKFTQEGKIVFGYNIVNDYMQFFVEDTGIGIKPQLISKIFERFRQGDNDITRQYGGSGLGLAISRGYARLLGGNISVKSEYGKGSAFMFEIPYNPVNKTNERDTYEPDKQTGINLSGTTILIAEDEIMNYMYLEELLDDYNANVIHAKNGAIAVKLFKENPQIDIVLMDIKMPELNGYDATKQIKQINAELPVIALTAFAMTEDSSKAKEAGCDGYLTKPVDETELIEKLNIFIQ